MRYLVVVLMELRGGSEPAGGTHAIAMPCQALPCHDIVMPRPPCHAMPWFAAEALLDLPPWHFAVPAPYVTLLAARTAGPVLRAWHGAEPIGAAHPPGHGSCHGGGCPAGAGCRVPQVSAVNCCHWLPALRTSRPASLALLAEAARAGCRLPHLPSACTTACQQAPGCTHRLLSLTVFCLLAGPRRRQKRMSCCASHCCRAEPTWKLARRPAAARSGSTAGSPWWALRRSTCGRTSSCCR